MSERNSDESTRLSVVYRVLPLLFVGSGCSALIYEIVWFQILQFVIGSSTISLGVLLSTFMGGMCLGSIGFSRVISETRHPLRVYALLELGVGVLGLALLFWLPYVGRLYLAYASDQRWELVGRAVVCSVCLLPPTILMGATLPAISRWMQTTARGVSRIGIFYGANIAGAVCGCLLAGFYLLRVHDIVVATCVAATINLAVAVIALSVAQVADYQFPADQTQRVLPKQTVRRWPIYLTIGLSGMSALGAEVIWTRILSLMLGATVYTFSIILAVFLIGLGIGSGSGSLMIRTRIRPRVALGVCQLLLVPAISWTAYTLTRSLPYWPIDVSLSSSPWTNFQMDLLRCMWAMLPACCLWGASFPLALAAAASRDQDPGRLVGGLYAANTLGAIAGSLLFSMLMVSWLGTQRSQQLLIVLVGVAALLMLVQPMSCFSVWIRTAKEEFTGAWFALGLTGLLGLSALCVWSVAPIPAGLVAYGRHLPTYPEMPEFLYVGEGMNASVAVSEWSDGLRSLHVSGKVVASIRPDDMRLQRMLGHVPALIHSGPVSVLIVGCGAGITAGSFVLHPDIKRIVICEIEPLIPPIANKYFRHENFNIADDPRVEIVYDDARHYIVTTAEKFDIITSDPIHPWVKGAAALYSHEYFEFCKQRLNPGGIVAQWVPLYESNRAAVQSQIATFFKSFAGGTIWSNDDNGDGYDIVLLGQVESTRIDLDELQNKMDRNDHRQILASLDEVNLGSVLLLLKTYASRASELQQWIDGAQINRDRNLRLQYLAGMALNSDESISIFDDLVPHRRYPDDLFVASGTRGQALRILLNRPSESRRQ